MNTRNLVFAVCCIAVSGLAACSQPAPPPPPPPAPAPVAAPAPPPPPAMPANLTPAQQKVAKVQMALNANGATLDVDGKWGSKTSTALKAFQSAHKLKPTGHMDGATAKALGL
ncbi:MAG TPA: peptidoglycan-binding domain-containing protein [Acetobacteraceae bacterium]|nr:peptidoglycan-binding domain-containing protein [Acetobacteraceae bacterium]